MNPNARSNGIVGYIFPPRVASTTMRKWCDDNGFGTWDNPARRVGIVRKPSRFIGLPYEEVPMNPPDRITFILEEIQADPENFLKSNIHFARQSDIFAQYNPTVYLRLENLHTLVKTDALNISNGHNLQWVNSKLSKSTLEKVNNIYQQDWKIYNESPSS